MANAWLAHVKRTMKAHKGQKFSAILKLAKKSYHKGKKHHGGDSSSDSSSDKQSDLANKVKKVESDGAADGNPVLPVSTDQTGKKGGRRRSSRRTRRHRRR